MPPLTEQDIKRIYENSTPVTRSAFKLAFDNLTRLMRLAQQSLTARIDAKLAEISDAMMTLSARIDKRLAEIRQPEDGESVDHAKVVQDVLKNIRQPKDGDTPVIDYDKIARGAAALIRVPEDGEDADPAKIVPGILAEIDKRVPLLEDALRAGLENRLKELLANMAFGPGGGTSFSIQQSGVQKVQQPLALNFKGTGAPTITTGQDGVTHLNFSGGGLSVLAATGTVDNSNTVFTFVSAPTLVVVNGAIYQNGHGVTIATTTATLDNPVGTGGSIFGLG